MTKQELIGMRKTIESLAVKAGTHVHRSVKSLMVVTQKERMDVATITDIEIEKYIKDKLHAAFPTHAFYADESGGVIDPNVPTWIIDPLDGTKEFIRDIPIFCITFCLMFQNEVLVSVVYNPKTQELFSAAKSCGAYKDGKKVHVTSETDLAKSHIFFRLPDYSDNQEMTSILNSLKVLAESVYRVRGIANQNIALCWIGMGGYDGYVNVSRSGNLWDYAPGSLFLTEAGGTLSLLKDKTLDNTKKERRYIVANPVLCQKLADLVGD